jgi:hypothetical protein
VQDVVVGGVNHQHQDERQAHPEAHFLGALGQGTAPDEFHRVVKQMAAIEQRYREQVQEADRDRNHGRQVHEVVETKARRLTRKLGDSNRATDLLAAPSASEHLLQESAGLLDNQPGLLRAEPERRQRTDLFGGDVARLADVVETMRFMSEKVSIAVPSMAVTRSPTLKPAASAGLPTSTPSTSGLTFGLP